LQALEKIANSTNWITIVLVLLFALIAIMKVIASERLKGYIFAIFDFGFVKSEVEEDSSFLSPFYSFLFIFSNVVVALVLSFILQINKVDSVVSFSSFCSIAALVFAYSIVKRLMEEGLTSLFLIKKKLRLYVVSKFSYWCSISFFLLILIVVFQFGPLNPITFAYLSACSLLLIFIFLIGNNKNLIFSELFYFILYLCAFEIAPLLTLFKLML
jgi:hypothetical protein